jgi:hypothetical protein
LEQPVDDTLRRLSSARLTSAARWSWTHDTRRQRFDLRITDVENEEGRPVDAAVEAQII